jgi:hypothetical protein
MLITIEKTETVNETVEFNLPLYLRGKYGEAIMIIDETTVLKVQVFESLKGANVSLNARTSQSDFSKTFMNAVKITETEFLDVYVEAQNRIQQSVLDLSEVIN